MTQEKDPQDAFDPDASLGGEGTDAAPPPPAFASRVSDGGMFFDTGIEKHPASFLFDLPKRLATVQGVLELMKIARVPSRQKLRIALMLSMAQTMKAQVPIRIIAYFLDASIGEDGKGRAEYIEALGAHRRREDDDEGGGKNSGGGSGL